VLERLLQINERAENLHRLRVPLEDRQEAGIEKVKAEQRLAELLAHPSLGGFGLHPEDKRVIAQRALIEQLTAQVDLYNARTEQANTLWQPAARTRQNVNDWSWDRPRGTAVEDWPTPLPKLNGKETLLDAIERYRRRGRELRRRRAPYSIQPLPKFLGERTGQSAGCRGGAARSIRRDIADRARPRQRHLADGKTALNGHEHRDASGGGIH
jgi:hypothetical protein